MVARNGGSTFQPTQKLAILLMYKREEDILY